MNRFTKDEDRDVSDEDLDEEISETETDDDEDETEDGGEQEEGNENEESEESEASGEKESGAEEIDAEADGQETEEGELVVSIDGDEPANDSAKPNLKWVRKVQRNNRKLAREVSELRERLQAQNAPKASHASTIDPGPKPKAEDFDYDTDAFERALDGWHEKRQQAERAKAEQERQRQEQERIAKQFVQNYKTKRDELKAEDFDDAEEIVELGLDEDQFKLLKAVAKNPALVVYALGKNPKRLKQLAQEKLYSKFIYAVAEIEGKVKAEKRKPSAPPEKRLVSRTTGTGDMDSKLERARKKAAQTGDMSEVIKLRAQIGR